MPASIFRAMTSRGLKTVATQAPSRFKARKAAMTLTPAAVDRLRRLIDGPNPKLIRVAVKNKGCAGLSYDLEYTKEKGKFDEVVTQDGVTLLIDSKSLFKMIGSEMDYVEDKLSSKFVFNNPNVKEACGCALIPPEMWGYPSWIDQTKAAQARVQMSNDGGVPYGGLESYYHMCRFNSGFFFRHPLLQEYDYYWRVEPHVEFYCDIDYDPFAFIQKHNISYGFTISLKERPKTIPTLWQHVRQFVEDNPQYLPTHNSATFISDNDLTSYNFNFEIGDLRFYRSEAYLKFFEYLDRAGGFFYERWGDAPIHSIAASLFLNQSELHFFNDIGYRHGHIEHCPPEREVYEAGNCRCNPKSNFGNIDLLTHEL
ncbi:803_t:CDS:2 [Paraglomus brasilianum]|uniref:Iron-sulfur assembly protein 1 n=1 Tax=Paraglomus brasilianum TaxID=144538 RepID=A0A9N8ZTS8_9GLOM|nr:803_t:CDS:2 [Paraglomus brasilianum]